MGIDFITKCADSFNRGWSNASEALAAPDLFTLQPELREEVFLAKQKGETPFIVGAVYLAQLCDSKIIILDQNREIGEMVNPPPSLIDAFREANGLAPLQILRLHQISGNADVRITY